MVSLVKISPQNGDLVADSRQVAEVLGVDHRSVIRLMSRYEKELGPIGFEVRSSTAPDEPFNPNPEKWANLTERQCLGLITLVRNTEEAVALKLALVDAFLAMRRTLAEQADYRTHYFAKAAGVTLEVTDDGFNREWFSVSEWWAIHGKPLTSYPRLADLVMGASEFSYKMKKPPRVVFDPQVGDVKAFHREVLAMLFEEQEGK